MDFALSDEQRRLRDMGRDFLKKECPASLGRKMERDLSGHPRELWQKDGRSGLAGPSYS